MFILTIGWNWSEPNWCKWFLGENHLQTKAWRFFKVNAGCGFLRTTSDWCQRYNFKWLSPEQSQSTGRRTFTYYLHCQKENWFILLLNTFSLKVWCFLFMSTFLKGLQQANPTWYPKGFVDGTNMSGRPRKRRRQGKQCNTSNWESRTLKQEQAGLVVLLLRSNLFLMHFFLCSLYEMKSIHYEFFLQHPHTPLKMHVVSYFVPAILLMLLP